MNIDCNMHLPMAHVGPSTPLGGADVDSVCCAGQCERTGPLQRDAAEGRRLRLLGGHRSEGGGMVAFGSPLGGVDRRMGIARSTHFRPNQSIEHHFRSEFTVDRFCTSGSNLATTRMRSFLSLVIRVKTRHRVEEHDQALTSSKCTRLSAFWASEDRCRSAFLCLHSRSQKVLQHRSKKNLKKTTT